MVAVPPPEANGFASPAMHQYAAAEEDDSRSSSGLHSSPEAPIRHPKSTPLPTHPLPPVDSPVDSHEDSDGAHAGPSRQREHSIPPPAHARRHRSGVLMSAARSRASSGGFRGGVIGSKSFGDLSLGLTMSSAEVGMEEELRRTGEGSRRASGDGVWDNSARFYHHLHSTSRPVSRQTSPERSQPQSTSATPARQESPSRSSSSSPIHIRRSQVLPTNGPGPPIQMPSSALSPAHAFLQSHLPPLFPSPGSSPEHPGQAMVILTPTTAEWKEMKKEMGELDGSSDSSGRRSSLLSAASSEDVRLSAERPSLISTMSADYLERERVHTPDPGDQDDRPVLNLIAPSPIHDPKSTLSPVSQDVDPDQPIQFDRDPSDVPQRYASIGRRESLRAVTRLAQVGRTKTKRELERERLFKDLDEYIEAEKGSSPPFEAVQQIGQGLKLSESGSISPGPDSSTDGSQKRSSLEVSPKSKRSGSLTTSPSLSPSTPFKPSPLHASPVVPHAGLPLAESPSSEVEPGHSNHTANLETIRDYARSLADPEQGDGSPKRRSPRLTHRRDLKRVSLVAGRVIQPFSVPPDTALPPASEHAPAKKASLNSFSPFRTPPSLTPSPSAPVSRGSLIPHGFPGLNRMDSTVSVAPSTGPPSEPGTPSPETVGGLGGRGIDDYVILSEAGKGAYGLVMRAKVKGQDGEPVGEEVIIKYIVKVRILADCWKKHKVLGPIPVEIHVMDQLRHLMYPTPPKPNPWDPSRGTTPGSETTEPTGQISALQALQARNKSETPSPDSVRSRVSRSLNDRVSPERGHPNICKLLDFFEDREFYYMVMPRFGSGLDLFDRVEASPNGLPAFDVRSLIGQLADAVRFLHANGIVHRDIKDENVILDGQGRCQLIDFGSAAHWRPGKRWDTFSGTLHYASPEILRGEFYGGKEQDVYALGTVLYVLLVGETPFAELPDEVLAGLHEGSRALEALQERCQVDDDQGEEDGGGGLDDAKDLVMRCLEMEVSDRPSAEMVCNHRFLRGNEGWKGFKGWVKPRQ